MQTIFLIGAIIIFTTLAITFNQKRNIDTDTDLNHEAAITAVELGDAFLNDISRKAFDETTVNGTVDTVISLTPSASLHKETGENNENDFDDIDDYNGYTKTDTLNKLGIFSIGVSVYYVNENYPDIKSSSRTFIKRIDLKISNTFLQDTIKLFYLAAY